MTRPDPGPDRSPWEEYRAAALALDAVRREAAAVDAEATRVASSARAELAEISAQLARQQARLATEADQLGIPLPPLTPTDAERAAAEAAVAGDPAAVPETLGDCRALLAAVDAQLSAGGGIAGRWRLRPSPVRRWLRRLRRRTR